ncbi:MAG: hypothetical protein JNM00_04540, partial [Flavobacteriales bacterium]|nr:hypothetical protein [Flavobacteriales bacterium]
MKKLFTLLSLFFALYLGAQELPYTLTSWNETYNDLENPILLTDDEVWDDPQFIIPVGFTFEMMGETFEQLLYMDPGVLV